MTVLDRHELLRSPKGLLGTPY